MNKSNLNNDQSYAHKNALTQANASVTEREEKTSKGSSLLPPELSFPTPQEETEDLQEDVKTEEKQESAAASLQTADDDDSSSDSNSDNSANGDNTPTLQLKNSIPKDQASQDEKSQVSDVVQKQAAPQETEDQQDDVKATEQPESTAPSKQTADDGAPSDNNNKPNTGNANSSVSTDRPFQLKKSSSEEQTNPIPGFQIPNTIQKKAQTPEKTEFELGETIQKQAKRPEASRFQLGGNETDGQGVASNGLPHKLNKKMAKAFKYDFSKVEIHTNSTKAKEVGAYAFAQGNEVHFAHGYYQPETREGQELIGHELAHVKQQAEGRVKPTTIIEGTPTLEETPVNDDQALEKEADEQGKKAARGEDVGASAINKGEKSDTLQGRFIGKGLAGLKLDAGAMLVNKVEPVVTNDLANAPLTIADGAELEELPGEVAVPEFTLLGTRVDINLENVIDSQVLNITMDINPIVTLVKVEVVFTDGVYQSAKLNVKIASFDKSGFVLYVDKDGVIDPTLTIEESFTVLGMEAAINAKMTATGVTGTMSVGITQPQQMTETIKATEGELVLDLSLGGLFNGNLGVESNDQFFAGMAEVDYDPDTAIWSGKATLSTQEPKPIEIYPGIQIEIPAGVSITFDFGYEGSSIELLIPFAEQVTLQSASTLQAGGLAEGAIVLNAEGVSFLPSTITLAVTGGLTTPDIETVLTEQNFATEFADQGTVLTLKFGETGELIEAGLVATGGFSTAEKRIGRIDYNGIFNLDSFTLDGALELYSEAELDIFPGAQFSLVMLVGSTLSVYHDETGIFAVEVFSKLALKQLDEQIAELDFNGAGLRGGEFLTKATITLLKDLQIIEVAAEQYGLYIRSGSSLGILFEDGALKQLDGTLGLGVQDTEGDVFGGSYTGIVAFDEEGELSISEGTAALLLLRDKEFEIGTSRVTILTNSGVEASFENGELSTIAGVVKAMYEERAFTMEIDANITYDLINNSLLSLEAELAVETEFELFKKEDSFLTLNGIAGSLIIKDDELVQIGGEGALEGQFGTISLTGEASLSWVNEEDETKFIGSGLLEFVKKSADGEPIFEGSLALSLNGSEFEASGEIQMQLTEALSGAASFHLDQEMDPTISASLEYTESVIDGEELWATEFKSPVVTIPIWYIFVLELGATFGASLNTTPLDLTGAVAIEDWKPGTDPFPHFNTELQAQWGIDFSAKVMLHAAIVGHVLFLKLFAGIRGGLGIDIPVAINPSVRLVSNEKGVGGEVGVNVSITPVISAILELYAGWQALGGLFEGEKVWPVAQEKLGEFADVHWEGSLAFGDQEALDASPSLIAPPAEQKVEPSANIIPSTGMNDLGYGNNEAGGNQEGGLNNTTSSITTPNAENKDGLTDFFGDDSELKALVERAYTIAEKLQYLQHPFAFASLILEFAEDILKDGWDFAVDVVQRLEETAERFGRDPFGTTVNGILNTAEDIGDAAHGVLHGAASGLSDLIFGEKEDKLASLSSANGFAQAKTMAINAYGHISYYRYIYAWFFKNGGVFPVTPFHEIGNLVHTNQFYIDELNARIQAPGKIDYAHPWETFETIASIAYGEPKLGWRLQEHNPAIAEVKEGDTVIIPSKEEIGPSWIEVDPIPVGNSGLSIVSLPIGDSFNDVHSKSVDFYIENATGSLFVNWIAREMLNINENSTLAIRLRDLSLMNKDNITTDFVKNKAGQIAELMASLINTETLSFYNDGGSLAVNINLSGSPEQLETTALEQANPGDTIALGNHSLEYVAEKVYEHKERVAWIKEHQTKAGTAQPAGLSTDAGNTGAATVMQQGGTALSKNTGGQIIQLPTVADMMKMDALPLDKRGLAPDARIKVENSDSWSSLSLIAYGTWEKGLALSDYGGNSNIQLETGEEIFLPKPIFLESTQVKAEDFERQYIGGDLVEEDLEFNAISRTISAPTEIATLPGDTWSGLAQAAYGDFSLFPKLSNYQANSQIRGLVPGTWVVIPKKEDLDNVDPYSLGMSLNNYPLLTEMVIVRSATMEHHVWVEDRRDLATRNTTPFNPADKPGVWMMASNPFELTPEVKELKDNTDQASEFYSPILDVWGMTQGDQTTSAINKTKSSIKKITDAKLIAEEPGNAVPSDGTRVEKMGIVFEPVFLRSEPSTEEHTKLGTLGFNYRVFILKEFPGDWYFVVTDYGSGYVAKNFIWTHLPDPKSTLYTVKEDPVSDIISHYKGLGYAPKIGFDDRHLLMGLWLANQGGGVALDMDKFNESQSSIVNWFDNQDDNRAVYDAITFKEGLLIWLPGIDHIKAMADSGEILTRPELVDDAVALAKGVTGFLEGLMSGFFGGIWTTVKNIVGLVQAVEDTIEKIVKDSISDNLDKLYEIIESFQSSEGEGIVDKFSAAIKEMFSNFKENWDHPIHYDKWKFRGKVAGAAILEVIIFIFTGGIGSVIKWAAKLPKPLSTFLTNIANKLDAKIPDDYKNKEGEGNTFGLVSFLAKKVNDEGELTIEDARDRIIKATEGFGTDEEAVYDAITRCKDHRSLLNDSIVMTAIEKDMNGHDLWKCYLLMEYGNESNYHPSIKQLWNATISNGTDESEVFEALQNMDKRAKESYGLDTFLRSELSGSDLEQALSLISTSDSIQQNLFGSQEAGEEDLVIRMESLPQLVDSNFVGAASTSLKDAMNILYRKPEGSLLNETVSHIESIRGLTVGSGLRQYNLAMRKQTEGIEYYKAKMESRGLVYNHEVDNPSPALDMTKHSEFSASNAQLRFGKIVGDVFGIDAVFGSLISPTGGMAGPGNSRLPFVEDGGAVATHGALHDAAGYLYNAHGIGPGYDYMNIEPGSDPTNSLAGQTSMQWWIDLYESNGMDVGLFERILNSTAYLGTGFSKIYEDLTMDQKKEALRIMVTTNTFILNQAGLSNDDRYAKIQELMDACSPEEKTELADYFYENNGFSTRLTSIYYIMKPYKSE